VIVGVPDFRELHDTATGWLNLAWEITIHEMSEFQEAAEFLSKEDVDEETKKYWNGARYKLNNAISILQQSFEIELKARIAKVSPFLLIAGDPQSWPGMDASGRIDFSDFRTLDSVHLCKVCNIASDSPLPIKFIQLYSEVRKTRNKIAHLNAGNMKAESTEILLTILTAHGQLYQKGTWMQFRRKYMLTEQKEAPQFLSVEDVTNDTLNYEFETLRWSLTPQKLREFFGYDVRKRELTCFNCEEQRSGYCDRNWAFAQRQKDGTVKCTVCDHIYTQAEYKTYEDEAEKERAEVERKYGGP
jgi:hypothetical protein